MANKAFEDVATSSKTDLPLAVTKQYLIWYDRLIIGLLMLVMLGCVGMQVWLHYHRAPVVTTVIHESKHVSESNFNMTIKNSDPYDMWVISELMLKSGQLSDAQMVLQRLISQLTERSGTEIYWQSVAEAQLQRIDRLRTLPYVMPVSQRSWWEIWGVTIRTNFQNESWYKSLSDREKLSDYEAYQRDYRRVMDEARVVLRVLMEHKGS